MKNMDSLHRNYAYGVRLAIIYSFVWFIDLLDASSLNIALPAISEFFHVAPTNAEWTIVGFLLSMTIGISISCRLGDRYGVRNIFLLSQFLYVISSLGCGFSWNIPVLIFFRTLQGFAGGMAIPLGMSTLIKTMPQSHWAKTTASMNAVTLLAPALGPIFGAYVTSTMGWRWIFFLKLPLSILCLFFSLSWVKEEPKNRDLKFDWPGFIYAALGLSGFLWVLSEAAKINLTTILIITALSALCGFLFIKIEKQSPSPLIPLAIFKNPHFTFGNLIQSAANTIFLGANFLIALYLQQGLNLNLVSTGWVMAAITPGMMLMQPIVGKFYNKWGPIPFIIPGLTVLSLSTIAFAFTSPTTSIYILAALVFCIGAASSITQTANVTSIFSGLSHKYKGPGSSLYALFKQVSASFGVALSAMILSFNGNLHSALSIFHTCFIILGIIPAGALLFCFFISNKKAIKQVTEPNHIPTEAEFGTE